MRENWQQLVDEARHTRLDHALFLENLLECEWHHRLQNGQARRIKEAKFPLKKYLVDFKRGKYDPVFLPKFEELETLAFIPNKENIILLGTSGAGKTHLAIALGIAACMKGHSVLFATVPNLIIELKETMGQGQMSSYRKRFERYDLVILDELGYVSMDNPACETLFNLISYGMKSALSSLLQTFLLSAGKKLLKTQLSLARESTALLTRPMCWTSLAKKAVDSRKQSLGWRTPNASLSSGA